jgi:penicillin-binding protein 1A
VPAVKVLQEIELDYFIDYLRGLGVSGTINPDLSLALGSKGMTLEEITKLYSLFPRLGMRIEPVFILKISDQNGKVLEEHSPADIQREAAAKWLALREQKNALNPTATETAVATQTDTSVQTSTDVAVNLDPRKLKKSAPVFDDPLRAIDEKTAYIMSYLLQDVVLYGTATNARSLKKKVGGKTGTTNEYIDAWFLGFSPEVVTGVWTGFDNPRTLGPKEVGSRAALPAWTQYMESALAKFTGDEYSVPKGIVFVRIDPKTGAVSSSSTTGVKEPFVEGTGPNQHSNSQAPDSSEFFREDI